MLTFPVAHCFIRSESISAFVFINNCLTDLFFFDDYPGPSVMLEDFSSGLSQAMLKTMQQSRLEAGMSIAWKLANKLDQVGTNCTLQLCSWNAAEAIKKRLITYVSVFCICLFSCVSFPIFISSMGVFLPRFIVYIPYMNTSPAKPQLYQSLLYVFCCCIY